jgi:hypothetical protein
VEKLSRGKWATYVIQLLQFLQFSLALPITVDADLFLLRVDQDESVRDFDSGEVVQVLFLFEIEIAVCRIKSSELALPIPGKLSSKKNEPVGAAAIEFIQTIPMKFG